MSEATYIVCHELVGLSAQRKGMKSVPFLEWVRKPDGDNDLAYRQLGFFGDRLLARAKVVDHAPMQFSKTIPMESLVEITGPHGLHLLLAEYRMPASTGKRAYELRRPGLTPVRNHYESAGFELDRSSTIRSTAMSFGLDRTDDNSAHDGWLALVSPLKEGAPSRDTFRMMVLIVAIERQLITQAERRITKNRFSWGLHSRRRVLRTLPRVPSADSEEIIDQFEKLRSSLRLDIRREQVLEALEVRVRRLEFSIAIFIAVLALLPGGVSVATALASYLH